MTRKRFLTQLELLLALCFNYLPQGTNILLLLTKKVEIQKDIDSLPDYDPLDQILFRYIELNLSPLEIIEQG